MIGVDAADDDDVSYEDDDDEEGGLGGDMLGKEKGKGGAKEENAEEATKVKFKSCKLE